MPQEHRLEDLKKSSAPALRHPELVALARSQSPSQAYKLARSAGWPNRQAKAVRSLAMVRRDHTPEAFEAFVATMEHARAESSVTEQVQDNRRGVMESRVAENLRRVTDHAAKLRLAAKHGLKDEVAQILNDLTETREAFFWTDHEGKDILFDTLTDVHTPGMIRLDNPDDVKPKMQHMQRNLVAYQFDVPLVIDLSGLQTFLGWTDEAVGQFVRKILAKIVARPIHEYKWRMLRAVTAVRRAYLPDDDTMSREVEIWLLRAHLAGGRLFELRKTALPTPIEESPADEARELDPIVDRFLELGWTQEQVCTEFIEWIRRHAENCRPQWMLAVAGAKCFNHNNKERNDLVREKYRPKLWNEVKHGRGDFAIAMFTKFKRYGARDHKYYDADKAFYRTEFVEMLAQGRLNQVYQLLLILGHDIGLFYAELEQSRFEDADKFLGEILPEAFWKAYSEGRYGVAAAMVQQFGAKKCFSEEQVKKDVEAIFKPKREAVNAEYADIVKRWHDGEDDEVFEVGRGKEWKDASAAVEQEHKEVLARVLPERQEQIKTVTQLAFDLDQPIRFEGVLTYYVAPTWPKY